MPLLVDTHVYNMKFPMPIKFMLQPEEEAYWVVAYPDQNDALNE